MPSSFALGPPKDSPGQLFLKSQLFTSPRWPCSDTNLTEKVALVTGATSGLGLEACRQLLDFGLSGLIMAVRSTEKGAKVASDFGIQYPEANIKVWHLEMESYDSVRALACRAETELLRLDIAILNAGMQTANFTIIPSTGHEK